MRQNATLLAGAVVAVIVCWYPGSATRAEYFVWPKEIALGLTGGLAVARLLAWRAEPVDRGLEAACACFFVLGCALALLTNGTESGALRQIGRVGAALCILSLALRTGAMGTAPWARKIWVAVGAIVAVCVVGEAYGLFPFVSEPGRRPGGFLGNRNVAARLLVLWMPLSWHALLTSSAARMPATVMGPTVLAAAAIVLTRSRGAWLGATANVLLLTIAAWHVAEPPRRRAIWRRTAAWALSLVIGAYCAFLLPNRLGWGAAEFADSAERMLEYRSGTGGERVLQMKTTWEMFRANPVTGVGPGGWSVWYPAYASVDDPSLTPFAVFPAPPVPRGDIVPFAAEWGLVGLVALALVLLSLLRRVLLGLRGRQQDERIGAVGFLAMLSSMALMGLYDPVLRLAPLCAFAAMWTGSYLASVPRSPYAPASATIKRLFRVCLAAYGISAIGLAVAGTRDLVAARLMQNSQTFRDLYRAVNIAPNNVEARVLLASALVRLNRCDLAATHLARAQQLLPHSLRIRAAIAECRRVP